MVWGSNPGGKVKIFSSLLRWSSTADPDSHTGLAGRSAGKGTPIDPFEETPSLQSVLKPAGEMAARVM